MDFVVKYKCPLCEASEQRGNTTAESTPEKPKIDLKLWKSVEFLMKELLSTDVSPCFLQKLLISADCQTIRAIKEEILSMRAKVEQQMTTNHVEKNNSKRGT